MGFTLGGLYLIAIEIEWVTASMDVHHPSLFFVLNSYLLQSASCWAMLMSDWASSVLLNSMQVSSAQVGGPTEMHPI